MKRLSGKVAIVTGAGRGLGKAIATLFAAEGAKLAVVSLTPANVERTVAEIIAAGGEAAGYPCDVSDLGAIDATMSRIVERFGGVDILVNNAVDSVSATSFPTVMSLTTDQLAREFACGPYAALRFMQACQPHMVARGGGRIINMASGAGIQNQGAFVHYAMAKEAMRSLSRSAAREWGKDGITVNNICPIAITPGLQRGVGDGLAIPPTLPIPRWGSAEKDVAPVVLFLASEEGRYLTGYTLMADGGALIDTAR